MRSDSLLPSARIIALDAYAARVEPTVYALATDVCTIGRSSLCQLVVQGDLISRLHARIERAGPRYLLHDAGSANGTFVNSQRLTAPHLLADQDGIGLGSSAVVLRFFDPDPTFVPSTTLRYDERRMLFLLGQRSIDLSPFQLRLLRHLYDHAGDICTRESCAQAVWSRTYDPTIDAAALDRLVANVRSVLRTIDPQADLIKTRRGMGYELSL